ncbi:MAG: hypothetical protein MUC96_27305 [Myxococcaceae bacterium]|nr:hypothetical protein [Myxococcaceae bacterium]
MSGSARPELREPPPIRVGANCPSQESVFSLRANDPDATDTIRANWYIDPNERYVPEPPSKPEVRGNLGTRDPANNDRTITSPAGLRAALQQFADGQRHRLEVVVTDGEFTEIVITDPVSGEPRPFLDVRRDVLRNEDGTVTQVEAFRDEYVWLVEVSNAPCQ